MTITSMILQKRNVKYKDTLMKINLLYKVLNQTFCLMKIQGKPYPQMLLRWFLLGQGFFIGLLVTFS